MSDQWYLADHHDFTAADKITSGAEDCVTECPKIEILKSHPPEGIILLYTDPNWDYTRAFCQVGAIMALDGDVVVLIGKGLVLPSYLNLRALAFTDIDRLIGYLNGDESES